MRLPFGAQWAARATIFGHNQSINGPTWGAANWSSLPDLLSCQICQNAGGKIRHKTQRQIRLIKKQKHFVKIAQNAISFFINKSPFWFAVFMEKDTAKLTTSAICFMRLFVYIIFSPFFFITDIHTQSIVCQILCLYCLAKNTNWKATKSAPQSLAKKPNSAETRQKMVNVLVCCIFFFWAFKERIIKRSEILIAMGVCD